MIGGELFKDEHVESTAAVQPADRQAETRQRERQIDTDRYRDIPTDRHGDRGRETGRHIDSDRDRHGGRDIKKEAGKHTE